MDSEAFQNSFDNGSQCLSIRAKFPILSSLNSTESNEDPKKETINP